MRPAATWEMLPATAAVGNETPLQIIDREGGPEGRTICVIAGNLSGRTRDGGSVRLLDKQDLANATMILLLPRLQATFVDLLEWSARMGGWDSLCWREAETLLRQLRAGPVDS